MHKSEQKVFLFNDCILPSVWAAKGAAAAYTLGKFLTGEACSTCTAVRVWCVCGLWSVCHYKKCNREMIDEVVIEVDELDKGNISAEAGKQDE